MAGWLENAEAARHLNEGGLTGCGDERALAFAMHAMIHWGSVLGFLGMPS